MLAGVAMNAIVAFLIFTVLAAAGMPKVIDDQFTVENDTKVIQQVQNSDTVLVNNVGENSPASKAGIKADDRLLAIGGEEITNVEQVADLTQKNAGRTISILLERDGQQVEVKATLNKENTGQGYLGLASQSGARPHRRQRRIGARRQPVAQTLGE